MLQRKIVLHKVGVLAGGQQLPQALCLGGLDCENALHEAVQESAHHIEPHLQHSGGLSPPAHHEVAEEVCVCTSVTIPQLADLAARKRLPWLLVSAKVPVRRCMLP